MNLKWLHDEVAQILDEPFCIELSIWNHRHDGPNITVSIWDGHTHHIGSTPANALDALKIAHSISVGPIPTEVVLP